MRAQRDRVIRHVRSEDDEAALIDEFVECPLDRFVGAVRQTDDIALHELYRTVDEPGVDCLVENHPNRVEGVVVGLRPGRIVVEQSDFQRRN